ncbi:peptide-methionine (S)-S-oxide reductase MsrA [uncultured Clostridium sp.]|uniref:peptide-methionine (S)-S-oxide reductase MsrA n=1 Tax=uncultured Clostridium sp. TaxID=59620 RepID=UPI0028EFA682|nr:peptide-methionine (S)-S-oxide reductase MsrA [uncultured Clostridium sp.]
MKEIVLAGGCFWGLEEYISRINGVLDTKVGYANGQLENPTYEQVCKGSTGHAEACFVKYDENTIGLEELLRKFWDIIDPTVINKQGPDIGHQYRTGIYYLKEEDSDIILKSKEKEQKSYSKPIVTEIESLKSFYPAEEYHQKYLKKNPGGYCHIKL